MVIWERLDGYSDQPRPLRAYAGLTTVFNAGLAGVLLALRRSDRELPERVGAGDILLLGVATHRLSRLLAKDSVTSFLRAPFTRFEGSAGEGEVRESVRGEGVQHALGELLTCPYCMGQWVAAGLTAGLLAWRRLTRLVGGLLSVIALADFLHLAYEAAKQRTQPPEQRDGAQGARAPGNG